MSLNSKVEYVKSQKQTRDHHCHWPGCEKQCPPAMWGCKSCWFKLPKYLRDKIWATYRPGQEVSMTPSREYVKVAREVQDWIMKNHPSKTPEPKNIFKGLCVACEGKGHSSRGKEFMCVPCQGKGVPAKVKKK